MKNNYYIYMIVAVVKLCERPSSRCWARTTQEEDKQASEQPTDGVNAAGSLVSLTHSVTKGTLTTCRGNQFLLCRQQKRLVI